MRIRRSRRSGGERIWWVDDVESTDRHRADDGSRYQPVRRWKSAGRRSGDDLIGGPIGPDEDNLEQKTQRPRRRGKRQSSKPRKFQEKAVDRRSVRAAKTNESSWRRKQPNGGKGGALGARSHQPSIDEEVAQPPHVPSGAKTARHQEAESTQEEDDTPRSRMSISLAVSEVEPAVLEGIQLGDMIAKVVGNTWGRPGPTKKNPELVKTHKVANFKGGGGPRTGS